MILPPLERASTKFHISRTRGYVRCVARPIGDCLQLLICRDNRNGCIRHRLPDANGSALPDDRLTSVGITIIDTIVRLQSRYKR